jgi:hypothetical protein
MKKHVDSFEEAVEKLSLKYGIHHGQMYDTMLYVHFKLITEQPRRYMFNRDKRNEQAYKVMNKYYGIKQFRDFKLIGVD